jgi:flagellar hook-associated protein 2
VSTVNSSLGAQSIGGLASGLDTASIISALMSIAKQPQVNIQNKITVETARQQGYKDVLTQLQTLTTAWQGLTDVPTWADQQSVTSNNDALVSGTQTGGAAAGAYQLVVTQLARASQWTSSGATTAAADDTLHLATPAGNVDVAIKNGDTLDTIAANVNAASGSPVYASVLNGNLVLSGRQTGTANEVTVTTDGPSGLSFAENRNALDVTGTVDGVAISSGSNIVTSAVAGVTLTLKGTTAGTTVIVGNPAPNTQAITDKLNTFITTYNSTVEMIMSKLDEQPVPNAKTDADRVKGVLNGDTSLEGLLSRLRNAFADPMTGGPAGFGSLAQIGLSTGAAVGTGALSSDSIDGKLTLDATTFQNALSSNFAAVKSLFNKATGSYATEGLAQRLNDIVNPYTAPSLLDGILGGEIDGEAATIRSLQQQSADWDTRLALKQQMLETQFTNLETAMSQSQSQSSWLSGQISQLSANSGK